MAVFEPFIGEPTNRHVDDTRSLQFKQSNLLIIGSSGDLSEQQTGNFMHPVPPDDASAHGAENIAFIDPYHDFRSDENRIGALQRGARVNHQQRQTVRRLSLPENCHAMRGKRHFHRVSRAAGFDLELLPWIE